MLTTTALTQFLWIAVMVANAAVAATILSRGLLSKWPSLFAITSIEVIAALVLFAERTNYSRYFYIAWSIAGIQAVLRLWLLADVFVSVPGLAILPAEIKKVVGVAGLVIGAGCAAMTAHDPVNATHMHFKTILLMDRCIDFAWGGFFVVFLASLRVIGLGWATQSARVTIGVATKIAAGVVISSMMSFGTLKTRQSASTANDMVGLIVLSFWTYSLLQTEQVIVRTDADVLRLRTLFTSLSQRSAAKRESRATP